MNLSDRLDDISRAMNNLSDRLDRMENRDASMSAAGLGRMKSDKKTAAARENGKKGGRPVGAKNKPKNPDCE